MRPESPKYLWDALTAADLIADFVAGRDFDAYRADPCFARGWSGRWRSSERR
jgi:hypothetical protein